MGRVPMTIVEGGTYSGLNITSNDDAPLIHVATTQPVVIEDSYLEGRSGLITCVSGADVTVRHTHGVVNPSLLPGVVTGRFAHLSNPKNLLIEGCTLDGTAGIYVLGFSGDGSPGQQLIVRANRARNIRGFKSDGLGGYTSERGLRQFAQFDKCNMPNAEVAWNEIINEPGESSVEDVINVYQSGGTPEAPLRIHHNFIRGAYPPDPANDTYSGGGILLGDGADPAAHDTLAEYNVILDTTNHGIGIAGGENNVARFNRVFSAGVLADGTPIAAQNVGIYAWDAQGTGLMSGIEVTDNVVGFVNQKEDYAHLGYRNDYFTPEADVRERNENHPGPITLELYEAEHAAWLADAAAAEVELPVMD